MNNSLFVVLLALLGATIPGQTPTWGKRTPIAQPEGDHRLGVAYDAGAQKTVLYGSRRKSETWLWDGKDWVHVSSTGPAGTGHCEMVYDSKRKRVVMVRAFGDIWEWDGASWNQRTPPTRLSVGGGFKVAYDSKRGVIVLFGGSYSGWTLADTWEYDGQDWTQRSTGGPPHRMNHAMVFDEARGEVLVYGGTGIRNSNDAYYEDTWAWNGSYWREYFGITAPEHRQWSAIAYDSLRQTVVLYGGFRAISPSSGTRHDTWEWDGMSWAKIATNGDPRLGGGANLTFDSARDVVVLVGNDNANQSETWEYSAKGGMRATFAVFGAGCAGSAGVPKLDAGAGQLPRIGQNFTLEFASLPSSPFARVLGIAGASRIQWGTIALPLDLGVIGMPGCALLTSWDLPLTSLNITGGSAQWTIAIPNNAALNGGAFFVQGLVLEPGVNAFGAVITNGGAGRMGS